LVEVANTLQAKGRNTTISQHWLVSIEVAAGHLSGLVGSSSTKVKVLTLSDEWIKSSNRRPIVSRIGRSLSQI
jgi:hypothetical protein